jgi:Dyp-type peroxidase family
MIDSEQRKDIQGLLKRAYKGLPETFYIMLRIHDARRAKEWLGTIVDQITPASVKPDDHALHIAFTFSGIKKLVPIDRLTEPFSREFTEGICKPERSRILGDIEDNKPENWLWNGTPETEVDILLMIFAANGDGLNREYQKQKVRYATFGLQEMTREPLSTTQQTGGKEHFGFQDGMAQPLINGFGEENEKVDSNDPNNVQPGEFIFGFPNEYGKMPFSPKIQSSSGSPRDIGANGSYLVFRQIEQDVKGFWEFMYKTAQADPDFKNKGPVYIASKMMGRWLNGNPLHLVDDPKAPPLPKDEVNNFLFKEIDPHGFGCPIGSHIRKSNPRDGIDSDPATSIAVSKRHRILRRGRPYGEPLAESMDPDDMLHSQKDGKRGLYFICFNTNLSRQFEFIQHTWNNNPKFDGLYNDIDPVIGYPFLDGDYSAGGEFTIQGCPVRKKIKGIPQFVSVKGGGYFFMPAISILRLMSSGF